MQKLKHLVEYIFFIFITSFLKLFSVDRSASLCSFLARKIGPFLGVTKIARNNLDKTFGDEVNKEKIIDDLWDNYGSYIGEFPFINKLSKSDIKTRVEITGLEHVEHFKKNNQPFLMFLGHQANWDFMIRRITDIYPKFAIIYRKANNPYVDKKILLERNEDENIAMIPKGTSGAKSLVKAIKSGMSIAILVDQKMNDGIEVPFFDRPAMTAPAIARLSLQYNYPIIPCQLIRKTGSNFEIALHEALEYQNTGDKTKDCYNIMLSINKMLEKWIRQKPAQWFWFHNRWKG